MQISHENMGTPNKNLVRISKNGKGTITLYFSYETPVCFELSTPDGYQKATRENDWSVTTGKLLNELEPDKSKRIAGIEFENLLALALEKLN